MHITLPFALVILITLLAIFAVVGYFIVRPRILHWGATSLEASRVMAGDNLISDAILVTTRAISINVGPERVWPWLAQMGQGRGGFYSYDWLENLAGLNIHSSDKIIPELQNIKPGDLIPFWRGAEVNVVVAEPSHLLALAGTINRTKRDTAGVETVGGTWVFALEEIKTQVTRMVVRSRVANFPPVWLSTIFMFMLELMHFIMEHKMLRRIKEQAERK
ncbi:MAG: hypothetical protein WAV05_19220 [Anaerolineales bacterium]